MKAYALLEFGKSDECQGLLREIKPHKQTDPIIVKLLVLTMIKLGMNTEVTQMLENAQSKHENRVDINEQLFFAYVRENKLLK